VRQPAAPGPCAKLRSEAGPNGANTPGTVSGPNDATLSPGAARPRRLRRALLWGALVALLLVAQSLLVALTVLYESSRAQDETDAVAAESAADVRHGLLTEMQALQALGLSNSPVEAQALLRSRRDLKRLEWRARDLTVGSAVDTPFPPPLFSLMARQDLGIEAELACGAARRAAAPQFSRSYFVPLAGGQGVEVIDLCVPLQQAGREAGFLVGSFALGAVLETSASARQARRHEISFVEGDGTRLARAGAARGAGVYIAERVVDLPGATLQLRAD
jgi:two-component system, LuxR family, sensor histidine kinase DctS